MANRLKQRRVNAGMTQKQIAQSLGVTQPTYQRWESGAAEIPADKVSLMAQLLLCSTDDLLGKTIPIRPATNDDEGEDFDISGKEYYGEVSIHFAGGGRPLLMSISENARSEIFQAIDDGHNYIVFDDLGNSKTIVRRSAISDLYLSSDAYDDYGPDGSAAYVNLTLKLDSDGDDWKIIQALATDDETSDFDIADVNRVKGMVLITDEEYEKLVADGAIPPSELAECKERDAERTEAIFRLATHATYQLSSGAIRSVPVIDCDLHDAFSGVVEGDETADPLVVFQPEGYHRAIALNMLAVDYVCLPIHLYEQREVETGYKAAKPTMTNDRLH